MTNRLDEILMAFVYTHTGRVPEDRVDNPPEELFEDDVKQALSALVEEIIGGLEPDYIAVERYKRVDEAILRKELHLRELRNGVRKQQIERAKKLGFSL